MLHHRAHYDSVDTVEESTSLITSLADETKASSSSRSFLTKKRTLVTIGLAFLTLVALVVVLDPSFVFHLPLVGKELHNRHAQNVADDFILTFLTRHSKSRELIPRHDVDHHVTLQDGCEATVVILRHCEKGSIREHCSYVGYERSVYLATIFGNDVDERWPSPSYIFAMDAGHRHNPDKEVYREMETVLPLAVKANVTVDYTYDTMHVGRLAQRVSELLQTGEACGKVIVICWKHSQIPHMAHRLGCGPKQGCPADYPSFTFDQAWQVKFVYHKMEHSAHKSGKIPHHDVWQVYGNVEDEGFDPLAFSKKMGDYPPGGKSQGASWMPLDVEVPEQGLPLSPKHDEEHADNEKTDK